MECLICGEPVTGRFCTSCGASAPVATCPICGKAGTAGTSVCPDCDSLLVVSSGRTTTPATGPTTHTMGWWVSGALLMVLVLITALPRISGSAAADTVPPQAAQPGVLTGGPGSAANVDLSTMTPREAADRLFLRVMRAAAANDNTELQNFLPMAIGAYGLVDALDSQGTFRVALLQRIGGQEQAAMTTLADGLSADPSHLLLLGSALEVAVSLGQERQAKQFANRLVENYETESVRERPEYVENQGVLENLKRRADELLASDQ